MKMVSPKIRPPVRGLLCEMPYYIEAIVGCTERKYTILSRGPLHRQGLFEFDEAAVSKTQESEKGSQTKRRAPDLSPAADEHQLALMFPSEMPGVLKAALIKSGYLPAASPANDVATSNNLILSRFMWLQ